MNVAEDESLSIPEVVRTQVQEHPFLVFVKTVTNPTSLVKRNSTHGDPYLHDVRLFVGFREPEYDPRQMTKTLKEIIEGLKPHAYRWHASGARLHTDLWGTTTFHPAYLWLDEPIGVREETSIWVFNPNSPDAKEVMAQADIQAGQPYTRVERRPISRQASTVFLPSVPLAHLAATYEEMGNIPRQEDRRYPLRGNFSEVLAIEDIRKLERNPVYVQEMADRYFVGYTVPGIPGRL